MFTATWPTAVQRAARAFTAANAAQVRIGDNGNKLVANTSITQHVEIVRCGPRHSAEQPRAPRMPSPPVWWLVLLRGVAR